MLRTGVALVAIVVLRQAACSGLEAPVIPVGVWYKSPRTDADYVGSVAKSLKEHHFNTVVANEAFTREMIDIFAEQGVAVITRGDRFLDHPAVIASVVGDEPAPGKWPGRALEQLEKRYQELSEKTDKPLITCVVGDGLGVDNEDDPWKVWKGLEPKVRSLRWYGIARGHYGILHKRLYKGYVGYSSVLRIAGSGRGPYWIVLPSFGKNDSEAEHQNPSAAQMRGMMHLALAYGAKGILFYALQSHDDWQCLVAEESLKPADEKLAAVAEVAAKINAHAAFIKSLRAVGGDIRCPNSYVEAVGQVGPDRRPYLYTVNKNTRDTVSTVLLWWGERPKLTKLRGLFTGEDLTAPQELNEEGYQVIPLTLAPGEGKLIDLGRQKPEARSKEDTAELAMAGAGEREAKSKKALAKLLERSVSRKEGVPRTRKLLGPWLGKAARWDQALLGGKLLIDDATAYDGGGKLVGAYENEIGAFASWYADPEQGAAASVKRLFVTCGVTEHPRPMAILTVDVLPAEVKDHTFEVRLPMAPGLESVRRLVCDLSPRVLASIRDNANAANKLNMRNFRYFELYPRGNPNYCADTVLRPAAKGARGWLISRILEPRRGPVFPAEYRKSETPGEKGASLVLSGRGKEFRLKLLLLLEDAPADQEPRVYVVPSAKSEWQMSGDWYLTFRQFGYGRTVFTSRSPTFHLAVGSEDDKTVEDEMREPEGNE